MRDTLRAHFPNVDDFEDLLDDAEAQAKTEWEESFVFDIRTKYAKWGNNMFLSEMQRETLEKIAEAV